MAKTKSRIRMPTMISPRISIEPILSIRLLEPTRSIPFSGVTSTAVAEQTSV